MSLSSLSWKPTRSNFEEGRLDPRELTVISRRCRLSGRLVLLLEEKAGRASVETGLSSNFDRTTILGSPFKVASRLVFDDADGLVTLLGSLWYEFMLNLGDLAPPDFPYSGRFAKL